MNLKNDDLMCLSMQEKQEIEDFSMQYSMGEAVRQYEGIDVNIQKRAQFFEEAGITGFTKKAKPNSHSEMNKLKRENERLIRLVVNKHLIINTQKAYLKKGTQGGSNRNCIKIYRIDFANCENPRSIRFTQKHIYKKMDST